MGVKDIIKVEGPLDIVDFDILGFIDHNITVDIITDGKLVEKEILSYQRRLLMYYIAKTQDALHLLSRS